MGAIRVTNLGKAYKIYTSRFARLAEWLIPFRPPRHHLQWVLQDICFDINPGESVGIIGLNGAGKSTLLKMLVGTTLPTTGKIDMRGQVAALLELGMGFHADFTGRQNVLMAGQLLGMNMHEITALMPHIESFADIGEYIDQPVRIYSSGMQVRLAFSVATAKRPDILIVDEALSVGDVYFQHKSFERIREFRKEGTTLLIVSHDKIAIQSICDRAILLNHGKIVMQGEPESVMDYYNALLAQHQDQRLVQDQTHTGKTKTVSGTGEATIEEISLRDIENNPLSRVAVGQPILIAIRIAVHQDIDKLVLGCGVKDRYGQMMFGTNTFYTDQVITHLKKGDAYTFTISTAANLGVGSYSIHASLVRNHSHIEKNYCWIDGAAVFEVFNRDKYYFVGCNWNEMNFSIRKENQSQTVSAQAPTLDRELVIVDIGCRWGFADRFTSVNSHFRVYGFDPDEDECAQLAQRYKNCAVSVVPVGLAETSGTRTLFITEQPACSSLLQPDPALTNNYPALQCARHVSSQTVKTTTLDEWSCENNINVIDYMKIDTQGSELEILKGASHILSTVRCLEVEVEFNPIYLEQPLFSDVDSYLRSQGFMLWKLTNQVHYSRNGSNEKSLGEDIICYDDEHVIRHPMFAGQLYWANAFYVKKTVVESTECSEQQNIRDKVLFEALNRLDVIAHLPKTGTGEAQ